jgi:ParB/RepB/Spo0J family partition protein
MKASKKSANSPKKSKAPSKARNARAVAASATPVQITAPILVPLSLLAEMPERNVRRTRLDNVDDLVPSIRADGLLQNLVVVEKPDGTYGVAAGERRRRALMQLVAEGALSPDCDVAVVVVNDADAYEASVAENEQRLPMHPADQFEAFKALVDQGKGVEEIAARFNVTATVVAQRMRLASVAPELLEIYRQGDATLDQVIALSITTDHERQRAVWKAARQEWQREPRSLRSALAESRLNLRRSAVAKYVTIKAYEKAGGAVERDLFSADVLLIDVALVERLARESWNARQRRFGRLNLRGVGSKPARRAPATSCIRNFPGLNPRCESRPTTSGPSRRGLMNAMANSKARSMPHSRMTSRPTNSKASMRPTSGAATRFAKGERLSMMR